jgi:hypothetical protein
VVIFFYFLFKWGFRLLFLKALVSMASNFKENLKKNKEGDKENGGTDKTV